MEKSEKNYREYLINMVERPDEDYRFLLEVLWDKEFYFILPRDEDRGRDGLDLRLEAGIEDPGIFGPCRILEVLIALAKRYEFELYNWGEMHRYRKGKNIFSLDPPEEELSDELVDDVIRTRADLFWVFMENLGLSEYNRKNWSHTHVLVEIDEIISRWLERNFEYDGVGSPFPLKRPQKNMRRVELWYQLQAYIIEKHLNA